MPQFTLRFLRGHVVVCGDTVHAGILKPALQAGDLWLGLAQPANEFAVQHTAGPA